MTDNFTPLPSNLLPQTQPNKPVEIGDPKRKPDGTFGKGNIANPAGRPKRKTLVEMVQDELEKMPEGERSIAKIILQQIFNKKDRTILTEYWKHRDGMPKQKTEVSGPDGGPIPILNKQSNVISGDNSNS